MQSHTDCSQSTIRKGKPVDGEKLTSNTDIWDELQGKIVDGDMLDIFDVWSMRLGLGHALHS